MKVSETVYKKKAEKFVDDIEACIKRTHLKCCNTLEGNKVNREKEERKKTPIRKHMNQQQKHGSS